MKRNSSSWR